MTELLPFVVIGVAIGAVYGLVATGLVLTYKTSGIFNFGHGALATFAALLFYWLHMTLGLGWELSTALSVLVAGPLMGVAMESIARKLSLRPAGYKIAGTVGLILVAQAAGDIAYGGGGRAVTVPQFLPGATQGLELFGRDGVFVQYSFLMITGIAVLIVTGLYCMFRFSRTGTAMRAVVDDPDLLDAKGTNPARVRRVAWVMGSTLAALSGVLILPFIGFSSMGLTMLVVQAFGAAAIAAFASIPLTFVGGIVIGVASSVATNYVGGNLALAGLPEALPFIILFVVLLVLPRHRLVTPSQVELRRPLAWHAPWSARVVAAIAVLVPLVAVPLFAGIDLNFYTIGLTQAILFLSLGLLVRTSGQVSLCHSVFAAIGAVAFSQFAVDAGLNWFVAVVLACVVVVPIGAFLAIPAIRLSGLFLALATFGFGIMTEQLFYPMSFMFTNQATGRAMPRPSFAQSDTRYYYFVLALLVIVALVIVAVHQARLGRMLRGMADSPVGVATLGLSTNVTKVIVFCISASLAALAGILYGATVSVASTSDSHFMAFYSVVLIAMLAVAPFGEPWYAIFIGMLGAVVPAYFPGATTVDWMSLLFGVSAVLVAMNGGGNPMPAGLRREIQRFAFRARPPKRAPEVPAAGRQPARTTGEGLRVEELTVRFGGLAAVDGVSLSAPPGRITGLIGPNGAGKTSLFNACTGLSRQSSGKVWLHGGEISRVSVPGRARLGLGRTFQVVQLCDSLTVAENVTLGREAGFAGRGVISHLLARPRERLEVRTKTRAALDLCGIEDLAGEQVGALATGQRRLVELARCLAGPFDILLLDEPSSGLGGAETAQFANVLQRVVDERGVGVLLVEHDMSLVMSICQYIYVLDFGKLLFEGTPPQVLGSDEVRAAYLGGEGGVAPVAEQRAPTRESK